MTLVELIKAYGEGRGKEVMWKTIEHISSFLESFESSEHDKVIQLKKDLLCLMLEGHYDEHFASEQIEKMYYVDDDGKKHSGPFWTEDKMHRAYQVVKDAVPSEYNEYDVWVTMNMIFSDYKNMFEEWFPDCNEEEMTSKVLDMSIAFLDDEDAPYAGRKIWKYFN